MREALDKVGRLFSCRTLTEIRMSLFAEIRAPTLAPVLLLRTPADVWQLSRRVLYTDVICFYWALSRLLALVLTELGLDVLKPCTAH